MSQWASDVVLGFAPRRLWHHLEPPLPLATTAVPAGLLAFFLGFVIGIPAFFTYAARAASERNQWMLDAIVRSPNDATAISTGTYSLSILTLFEFLFVTPIGILTTYLVTTGALRTVSAYVDDPRGDPLLSGFHWAATSLWDANARERRRLARERREGVETPDELVTGEWAGLKADYVVIASRRKPEWDVGAIILTSEDWYRLGMPVDRELSGGLRTLYPLTKLEAVEVVRRGIQYELPPLAPRSTRRPQNTRSSSSTTDS